MGCPETSENYQICCVNIPEKRRLQEKSNRRLKDNNKMDLKGKRHFGIEWMT
jgi:hypothetical protein